MENSIFEKKEPYFAVENLEKGSRGRWNTLFRGSGGKIQRFWYDLPYFAEDFEKYVNRDPRFKVTPLYIIRFT